MDFFYSLFHKNYTTKNDREDKGKLKNGITNHDEKSKNNAISDGEHAIILEDIDPNNMDEGQTKDDDDCPIRIEENKEKEEFNKYYENDRNF